MVYMFIAVSQVRTVKYNTFGLIKKAIHTFHQWLYIIFRRNIIRAGDDLCKMLLIGADLLFMFHHKNKHFHHHSVENPHFFIAKPALHASLCYPKPVLKMPEMRLPAYQKSLPA